MMTRPNFLMDYWATRIADRKTLELTDACAKDLGI